MKNLVVKTFEKHVLFHRNQPPGEPIAATQLAAFKTARDAVLSQLPATLRAEGPQRKPAAARAVQ